MAAMAGASGTRSWLQAQHATWLTPKRMKVVTVGLFTAATLGSSVTISGSTPPSRHSPSRHAAGHTARP